MLLQNSPSECILTCDSSELVPLSATKGTGSPLSWLSSSKRGCRGQLLCGICVQLYWSKTCFVRSWWSPINLQIQFRSWNNSDPRKCLLYIWHSNMTGLFDSALLASQSEKSLDKLSPSSPSQQQGEAEVSDGRARDWIALFKVLLCRFDLILICMRGCVQSSAGLLVKRTLRPVALERYMT